MFPETIGTDRLRLARLSEQHVDVLELYDLFRRDADNVSEVFEYVPQEPYRSVMDAQERLEKAEKSWDENESAQYAVYVDGEELAGYTALFCEWDRRSGRIGFTLGRPYWGNGYAGECAMALTELAFDRLDLELVAIGHEEGNDRSKRAIEKYIDRVGGQYDGVLRNWTPIGDAVAAHHRYTVTQEEYERATAE